MGGIDNFSGVDLDAMPSTARGALRIHRVRHVVATAEALAGMAEIVHVFDDVDPVIVPWPVPGKRPLVPGTGIEGGWVAGDFTMRREGGVLWADNHAVARSYLTGWYGDPATASPADADVDTTRVLTHEANHHPDGGQVFFPKDRQPFVALLAPPKDDVMPDDFVAFWCDGSFGIHILPEVWHQPLFPTGDALAFDDKQGRVHACVSVDFVGEFGCVIEVPLTPPA